MFSPMPFPDKFWNESYFHLKHRYFHPNSFPSEGGSKRFLKRFFKRGQVKFALLELLIEKPMHGYQMIKALEEKTNGLYSPSPGSIYPTLQLLEDQGYITSEKVDGKNRYQITEDGKNYYEENKPASPFTRNKKQQKMDHELRHEVSQLHHLLGQSIRQQMHHPKQLKEILKWVKQANQELRKLIEDEDDQK
jgi:DNA-binding PadR family transcriptional regulator